jgi:hypothetical protein
VDSDLKDFLHTQLGVLSSQEKHCANLLIKYQIKDGITKQVVDTVDGISFIDQVEIIDKMQKIVDEYDGSN